MTAHTNPIVVQCSYQDKMCVDVVTQAPWSIVNSWCLSGEENRQELTVPVQHLYCRGSTITHNDV